MKKTVKNEQGITLVALVIIIIVLLILSGVTIAMLMGENGILTQASEAKIKTAIGAVKEGLKLEQGEKVISKEKVTPEILLAEGKVVRTVQQGEDGKYYMNYALKEKAYEGMQGLGKGNATSLKDIFLIDDKLNVKYITDNGKEYGDDIEEKILEDETDIRFSSKAFSEYVSTIAGVSGENMKFKWMKELTSLTITDPNVDSLQDLVFFPNLTRLQLGTNANDSPKVTKMEGIENCTKLKELIINFGPDKDYCALSNLYNLEVFNRVGGNDFEQIIDGLKFCPRLNSFYLGSNNIGENMKRISELENLKSLRLSEDKITKIEGLDNKFNLTQLLLNGNKISKIENMDSLSNLVYLDLRNNQITDITPLSANISLTTLDLKGNSEIDGNRANYTGEKLEALNKIGKILDRGGTINIDVDKLGLFTNYKKLDLNKQNLTTLEPLEGLTKLTYLSIAQNQITLEDSISQKILKSMTNLSSLDISNNRIKNITAINELKNLKSLYINGKENNINLLEIEDIISNLDRLKISTDSLKTIVNCDVNKIKTLNLLTSDLTQIPDLSKFVNLTKLNLSDNTNISNFNEVSKLKNLSNLNLEKNNLHGRMIDFSQLTNLTELNLDNNTLWDEDLVNLKELKNNTNLTIYLRNNAITNATSLLELDRSTKIHLSGNVNLTKDAQNKLRERFGNNVIF